MKQRSYRRILILLCLYIFVSSSCARHTSSFKGVTEEDEKYLDKARQFVDESSTAINFYAIVHDGYITVEGKKFDSVLVEGGERGSPQALLFAQRYQSQKGFFSKFKTIGNAAFIGETSNRLK